MRFMDLHIFTAAKVFSHCHYYEEMDDKYAQTRRWLTCLCEKYGVGDSPIMDIARCLCEMDEFICTMYK